jgi:hypothetical protein
VLHDTLVDDLRAGLSRYKALVERLADLPIPNTEPPTCAEYVALAALITEARALKETL